MELLVEIFAFFGEMFFAFGEGPDEERIEANIVALMAFSWFQDLTKNPEYKELMKKNDSVRHVIGKMRVKKMKKSVMYEERKERRLMKDLHKQLIGSL
ncbi:hypothetical protein [Pseudalkalibacillus hwajinpoensis]|uniref:Uncharacterized protein n=1 Tax=Guptibacillus hwajinpoensis TaxID=208199 RepID=A0A4U1MHA9_9BACL|nr:hypothetical protein [Pseudalkalibacillus hwajinpoensis]TKD70679.1 hypothetical protein FBF83_08645 [Pseudalkalibacillus hwajinpoensis]